MIIDGQQRITALMTAIAAQKVFNNEFKESRVKIAFNPFAALEYANGDSEAEFFHFHLYYNLSTIALEILLLLSCSELKSI